jgi:hypothetical protein
VSCCCEKPVAEAGDSSGKPKEGESPSLKAAAEQRLVKTQRPSVSYSDM